MIDNHNNLDTAVMALATDDDVILYVRLDDTDKQAKGLISGDEEDLTDMLFTLCLHNPDMRNIIHNALILVEDHEAKHN